MGTRAKNSRNLNRNRAAEDAHYSSLVNAIKRGYLDEVQRLLGENERSQLLWDAVFYEQPDIVRVLMHAGIRYKGLISLVASERNADCIKALLECGYEPDEREVKILAKLGYPWAEVAA